MSVIITQGDYIYYTDQTVGNPVSWSWSFPGGTPSTSTAQNPVIQYESNSSGLSATLTATNAYPISRSVTKNNIIVVTPATVSAVLSVSNSNPSLSQDVTYSVVGSPNVIYYTYFLPATGPIGPTSATSITVNSSSWLDITGISDSGSIYSTSPSSATVTAYGPYSSIASSTKYLTYNKKGYPESFNFLDPPGGIPGGNVFDDQTPYYEASIVKGIYTSSLGMAGNGLVIQVDAKVLPPAINNQSARVQGELMTYKTPSMDIFSFSNRMGEVDGQIIASQIAFGAIPGVSGSSVWNAETRYTIGNYMYPNDILNVFTGTFYFADTFSDLRYKYNSPRWWSDEMICDIFNDTSYASLSSRSLELSSPPSAPAATIMAMSGGYLSGALAGACLPCSNLVGGPIGPNIDLIFDIYASPNGDINLSSLIDTVTITISPSGATGNSPDGNLVSTNDTLNGPGIASIINTGLSNPLNSLNGFMWNSYIVATSHQKYAWKEKYTVARGGTVNSSEFEGLKISIKEAYRPPQVITKVVIRDNSFMWGFYGSPTYPTALPFNSPTPGFPWLAFNSDTIVNPGLFNDNAGQQRGWYFKD